MNNEDFNHLLGDFDEEKVQMEEAVKPFAALFKAYKGAGLTSWDAACIVAALLTKAMPEEGEITKGMEPS